MPKPDKTEQSFFYNLLVTPGYRKWRYILVVLVLVAISLRQTFANFETNIELLGDTIYLLAISTLAVYFLVIFLNFNILIPKLFLRKKYMAYLIFLLFSILLTVIFALIQEYTVYTVMDIPHVRSSYFNVVTLLDVLSTSVINGICIFGLSMGILLKYWMINTAKVDQLENEHLQSEVELTKQQVSPVLFSNVLKNVSSIVSIDPERASGMLMKLSEVLRYQLYDSNRETVLLSSEIRFLNNYLSLEHLYSENIEYSIASEGNVNGFFVPPLLFMPIVQGVVSEIHDSDTHGVIDLLFVADAQKIFFSCHCEEVIFSRIDYSAVRQRLGVLFPDNYTLEVSGPSINLSFLIEWQKK